uniref:snaclec EMS16 subunit beta-like n=1 Tax=Doryrhamphus excisus TaxID=161450 RepID=UPI0025ADAA0D|nr:snaclec EMS16 subunit beta-like [Doryrhamphus excisus]
MKDNGVCCPEGWTQLNDRCYIVQSDRRNFSDAESICNIIGGNLASIRDAVENVVVFQLAQSENEIPAWIGLHNAFDDGMLFWTDGTVFDFSALVDPFSPGASCAVMGTAFWSAQSCGLELPFVCLRESSCYKK